MNRTIDLNADLGEGFPHDAELLARVTSASISCGAHAGDRETILRTLHEARKWGVVVGAHPGFPDRAGFGRRERQVSRDDVFSMIVNQYDVLASYASEIGLAVRFLKPHGALYNQAQREAEIAAGVVAAAARLGLPVLGLPGGLIEERARGRGVTFVGEGFPDRRYLPDGRLAPRGEADAIVTDPAEVERQVVRLVGQGVVSLCVHGDEPRSVQTADDILAALRRLGIELKDFV